MVTRMDDMPEGTTGLRASGKLSREDYREVVEPALRDALESGELRVLLLLADFHGMEPGAWIEDVKTALKVGVGDHSAWKRFALVTDIDWVAKATRMTAWLVPGEVMIFDPGQIQEATAWVAGAAASGATSA